MIHRDAHDPGNGAPATSSRPAPSIPRERYLETERRAQTKSEYFAGQVFAMTGASRRHNLIVTNLIRHIATQLDGRPFEVYPSDMRLHVLSTGLYTYPDVSVVRGAPQLEDEHLDTLLNPVVLIEVLSDSTERYDRGRKAEQYRTIPSLEEYLLVRQGEPGIERYRRQGEGGWMLTEATGLDERIELDSVQCILALRDVYVRVF